MLPTHTPPGGGAQLPQHAVVPVVRQPHGVEGHLHTRQAAVPAVEGQGEDGRTCACGQGGGEAAAAPVGAPQDTVRRSGRGARRPCARPSETTKRSGAQVHRRRVAWTGPSAGRVGRWWRHAAAARVWHMRPAHPRSRRCYEAMQVGADAQAPSAGSCFPPAGTSISLARYMLTVPRFASCSHPGRAATQCHRHRRATCVTTRYAAFTRTHQLKYCRQWGTCS